MIFSFPHMCRIPYDVKDPSATLGMTIREDGLSHISFHLATGTNLRPFGAPPSRGRRESGHTKSRHTRIPLSQHHSLPRVGKVASIASRIGYWRDENKRE